MTVAHRTSSASSAWLAPPRGWCPAAKIQNLVQLVAHRRNPPRYPQSRPIAGEQKCHFFFLFSLDVIRPEASSPPPIFHPLFHPPFLRQSSISPDRLLSSPSVFSSNPITWPLPCSITKSHRKNRKEQPEQPPVLTTRHPNFTPSIFHHGFRIHS